MIWCIEDDSSIRNIELYTLNSAGMEARGFENGEEFFQALEQGDRPDLILLDVMLPGEDGVSILRRIRSGLDTRDIPVIMATAKGAEYDKVQSLDLGADDYLVKPFGMMEMVSRVKAVLRRAAPKKIAPVLQIGGLTLNPQEHTVLVDGERASLTYKEFELLWLFMEHPGTAFTRNQLSEQVWGTEFVGESRTIDAHIRSLRQKIAPYGDLIETVRNVGYRLEVKGR